MKINPLVDSVCIVGRSDQMFTVAIVVPDQKNLDKLAQDKLGKSGFSSAELCLDNAVKQAVCDSLQAYGLAHGLEKFEVPKKLALVLDEWSPESGLVTAAMKLKRKELESRYSREIVAMYDPGLKNVTRGTWMPNSMNGNSKVNPA